jgi:hypothetical protein
VFTCHFDYEIYGMDADHLTVWGGQFSSVHPRLSMDVASMSHNAIQRTFATARDGHVEPEQAHKRQRIPRGFVNSLVAVHGRNADKIQVFGAVEDGGRIIMSRITIYQYLLHYICS